MRAAHKTFSLVLIVAGLIIAALLFAAASPFGAALRRHFTQREATVVIPEGSTVQEIDMLVSAQHVATSGAVSALAAAGDHEGYLFPDTYRFFIGSDPQLVLQTMLDTFDRKATPILKEQPGAIKKNVIIASLLEKEVTSTEDRRIVAGLLKKRLDAGMPLQVDATVCYAKKQLPDAPLGAPCYPLNPLDFKIDSPYNTYLYKGLPPGPIGNPGLDALTASVQAQASPYWFYLTDPATKRTIFSKTLEEHNAARKRYLSLP